MQNLSCVIDYNLQQYMLQFEENDNFNFINPEK